MCLLFVLLKRLVKNDCRSSILTFKFVLLHKLKFPLVKIKLNDIIIICSERIFLFYNYWEESTITFAEEERGSEQFIHLSGCILSSDNSKHFSFSKSPLKASTNLLSTVALKERKRCGREKPFTIKGFETIVYKSKPSTKSL